MATFALAHMSCAGAWAWGDVPDRLRAAGHEVVAPDLTLVAGATPESHAHELAAAVGDGRPARSVILVGHSYGGLVVPRAAELLGDAAAALVVVDGLMPEPGESGFGVRPERAEARRAEGRERGDGMWTAGEGSPGPAWWSRLQPMPVSAFEAPVSLSGAAARLPGWFVHCLRSDFADQAARARARGWTVVEVDGVHALPLVDPAACAEILLRVAGLSRIEEEVVPVMRVADAARAVAWYGRLGFVEEWQHQFEPGLPWFVSVARGDVRLYLSEHEGDARPDTLIHLYVRDIDAVSEEFGVPVDEDGLAGRECHLVDPDGNRLRVATRRS